MFMTITTRLTKRFSIKHPIVLAPMTPASGGALASAVAAAGGLGLLGGGYVDRVWFEAESAKVTRPDVGAGFITWTIPEDRRLCSELAPAIGLAGGLKGGRNRRGGVLELKISFPE
jgi:NAD(P)H-dependent flavin oxidoreductase YrpB (nitropropane dioxygenase family)